MFFYVWFGFPKLALQLFEYYVLINLSFYSSDISYSWFHIHFQSSLKVFSFPLYSRGDQFPISWKKQDGSGGQVFQLLLGPDVGGGSSGAGLLLVENLAGHWLLAGVVISGEGSDEGEVVEGLGDEELLFGECQAGHWLCIEGEVSEEGFVEEWWTEQGFQVGYVVGYEGLVEEGWSRQGSRGEEGLVEEVEEFQN